MTLEPYRDEVNGFALLVPADWEQVDPPADEVRYVAVEPLRDQEFRTNVVVTVDELPEGLSLGGWQDGNDQLMPTMLDSWQLLDRWTETRSEGRSSDGPDGHSGSPREIVVRRLGHHRVQEGVPVTMRQVAYLRGATGLTLTTTIWTPAYADALDLVQRIEAGFPSGEAP